MFDCIQVYTTVLKLPTGERSCSDNISYSKRVKNTKYYRYIFFLCGEFEQHINEIGG